MTNDELLRRADMWLSEFHNKGGVTVPDDSYLAIIRDLAAALRESESMQPGNAWAWVECAERAEAALRALRNRMSMAPSTKSSAGINHEDVEAQE